jgi:hydrogenase nickel incorporation protein HypA/HybF
MHEVGLCESFMDAIERRAAGRRVIGVRLRVGVLHRVAEPSLAQAFELVSAGTVAEGAEVDLVTVPVRVSCPDCGHSSDAADLVMACPACGGASPRLFGGDELVLESIRLAEVSPDVPGNSR